MISRREVARHPTRYRHEEHVGTLPAVIARPMTIEQMRKDGRLDLRLCFLLIAKSVAGIVVTVGIHGRDKKYVFTVRRPDLAIGFS